MEFLLLISHDDQFAPTDRLVGDIRAWRREMDRRGLLRDGRPLRPPGDAVTVRVRDGRDEVVSGPSTAGPDHAAAYELLECESLQDAIDAAKTHPMAAAGTVEVRPVWSELAGPPTER